MYAPIEAVSDIGEDTSARYEIATAPSGVYAIGACSADAEATTLAILRTSEARNIGKKAYSPN